MKVSVIIPTYCPQDYFKECLDSLVNQSLDNSEYEIIIVLNGCGEPYFSLILDIINQYTPECNNILLKQTDVSGVSNARNIAMDMASGEYIAFVDDDDILSQTYLEKLLANASPSVIALTNTLAFYDKIDTAFAYNITKEYFDNRLLPFYKAKKYFSVPWAKLIHKDVIGDRRFNVNFSNGEDSIFMYLISDRIREVKFTQSDAIYYRRIRVGSATTRRTSLSKKIYNKYLVAKEFFRINYSKNSKYNQYFFVTRLLAVIKSIVLDCIMIIKCR